MRPLRSIPANLTPTTQPLPSHPRGQSSNRHSHPPQRTLWDFFPLRTTTTITEPPLPANSVPLPTAETPQTTQATPPSTPTGPAITQDVPTDSDQPILQQTPLLME